MKLLSVLFSLILVFSAAKASDEIVQSIDMTQSPPAKLTVLDTPGFVTEEAKEYFHQLDEQQRRCQDKLPRVVRIIRHGQRVTMEHSPLRLNIRLDADNHIIDAYCG